MTPSLTIEKTVLREQIRTRLKGISSAERVAFSRQVCERLPAQSVWQTARSILFYTPLADEVDVFPLFAAACAAGKKLAAPRFISENSEYRPFWIQDPNRDLEPGYFGIREPKPHCQPCSLNQLDLVLVPGVGFDLSGHRLGRGKGKERQAHVFARFFPPPPDRNQPRFGRYAVTPPKVRPMWDGTGREAGSAGLASPTLPATSPTAASFRNFCSAGGGGGGAVDISAFGASYLAI